MSESEFSYDNVMSYQEGELWYEGKPLYIVKVVSQHGNRYAFVYNVSQADYRTNKVVRKAWRKVDKNVKRLVAKDSPLAEGANARLKQNIVNVEEPYAFQAPIVGYVSSLSGKEGDGFFERIDRRTSKGMEKVASGAFIALEDIKWYSDKMLYDEKSLFEEIRRSSRAEMMDKVNSGKGREFYL